MSLIVLKKSRDFKRKISSPVLCFLCDFIKTNIKLLGIILFFGGGISELISDEIKKEYYFNNFEEKNDLKFWATNGKYTINYLGLSEDASHSGRKSVKLDVTLEKGSYCYFEIPINYLQIQPNKKYYLSGYFLPVRLPAGIKVGLGWSKWTFYGKGKTKSEQGNSYIDHLSGARRSWELLGKEIGETLIESSSIKGLPTDKILMNSIYIDIRGTFKGQRLVIYLDDLSLAPTSDHRLAAKSEKPQKAKVKEYPKVKEFFAYGVVAVFGGLDPWDQGSYFKVRFPDNSWKYIEDWKTHHINIVLRPGGLLYANSSNSRIEQFSTLLKIFNENNLYIIPSLYLSSYYRCELTKEFCEKAIKKNVSRFKDNNSVFAWWIIDEAGKDKNSLEDYLWAKRIYEEIDDKHPAIAGSCDWETNRIFGKYNQLQVFDCYPVSPNSVNPWSVGNWVSHAVKYSRGPVWFIPQAFAGGGNGLCRKPTVPELKLMSYLAVAKGAKGLIYFIYNSAPRWCRDASYDCLIDPFGSARDTWNELGRLGENLAPIGRLLLDAEPINSSLAKVKANEIVIAYEKAIPAIDVGILKKKNKDKYYLVIYNNDIVSQQKASIYLNEELKRKNLYDLYNLEKIFLSPSPDGASFNISLSPGDGKIYLISSEKDFIKAKEKILSVRFQSKKEIIKYKLYLAYLSGFANPEIISLYQRAENSKALADVEKKLDMLFAANQEFLQERILLSHMQKIFSEINAILEEKVKAPGAGNYFQREFDGKNQKVKEYANMTLMLGGWHLKFQILFRKGKWKEINSDVKILKELSEKFYRQVNNYFIMKNGAEVQLPSEKIKYLRDRIEFLEKKYPPSYPNPEDMFQE